MGNKAMAARTAEECPPVDIPEQSAEHQAIVLAMGWFWGPDSSFSSVSGVIRTQVGYSGGKSANPTYRSMGDHTECVLVEFDPQRVTLQRLLEKFWNEHTPLHKSSKQYQSGIWYFNDGQLAVINQTKAVAQENYNRMYNQGSIATVIEPAGTFYRAEEYHQKFLKKQGRHF